ncbi:MAG: hypothetical protein U9N04_04565 [Patescibacteria group bacterium]|nr:hypothetical protein [Patescibacteria group bacterium]
MPAFLEKQILTTIIYYDILNYPLTAFEVFLYLISGNKKNTEISELSSVFFLLANSEYLKKYLGQKRGFYFLKTRTDIVQQRLNRKKLADQKWKKAKKMFWIAQIAPFLKMVLVSGSLAMGNSKNESDIDLIITAKKGRIWIVRTFITLLTSLLGVRRHGVITKNKICLNHYITDESLKIPFESLYNAQSYLHLTNVYNDKEDRKLFKKFQEENSWIKKYARNYQPAELGGFRSIGRNKILGLISSFLEIILSGTPGNYLEKKLAQVQSGRIKKDKLYKKKGGRITIDDNQLEFHPDSHEANIIPEFNRRMEKLGLFEFGEQKDSGLTK